MASIDLTEIKRYQAHRLGEKRKEVTINGEKRVLRQLLGWLVKQGELVAVPEFPRLREERRIFDVPTVEEVVALLGHLHGAVKVLVWLMAETGMRPDEARNLPWAHVDADEGVILIRPHHAWRPKTPTSVRQVYPSDTLMGELLRLPRTGDFVFAGTDPGKPVQNVRTAIATAAKRAGFRHSPAIKLFRKAFATTLAERGINQTIVGDMLGHAPGSKVTAQHYQFIREKAKRANRLSLMDISSQEVA